MVNGRCAFAKLRSLAPKLQRRSTKQGPAESFERGPSSTVKCQTFQEPHILKREMCFVGITQSVHISRFPFDVFPPKLFFRWIVSSVVFFNRRPVIAALLWLLLLTRLFFLLLLLLTWLFFMMVLLMPLLFFGSFQTA